MPAVFVINPAVFFRIRAVESGSESIHESSPSATISREIVKLVKSITGRGPTKARTHVLDDCVVVLMREGHTVSEQSMAEAGQQRTVAQSRVDLSEDQRARFIDVVEQTTGRRVISFLTSSHQDPSILVQVFVLETALSLVSEAPPVE
jgi:uncharacterized protein YbcI